MGSKEVDAGHGVELTRPVVQQDVDMRQRLETRTEPRFRLPDSLRDRADATAIERVEVQNAVRLAEPERAQHDRLGPVGAAGHGVFSLVTGTAEPTPRFRR